MTPIESLAMPDMHTINTSRSRHFANPALAALVVLPFGILAAISMVRELRVPRQPVEGIVLVDGVPQRGVELAFHRVESPGYSSPLVRAWTDSHGRFQVRTLGVASGMPMGEYVATARHRHLEISGEALTQGANSLDRRYAEPTTTPLRLIVGPGVNSLETWQLERCRCEPISSQLARR